jgi:hypothetical protein
VRARYQPAKLAARSKAGVGSVIERVEALERTGIKLITVNAVSHSQDKGSAD